ncbi:MULTISPECIES: hypothetical protein [Ensifer]|nr:hypothetical protein [Ensifer adhaerens]
MDIQQRHQEAEEKQPTPKQEDQLFDPWEQAFNRNFQKHEREFEF